MIKIFAISVEHTPYANQKITASVGYDSLLVAAAQSLSSSDKMRLAIIELIIVMTGEKRNNMPGVLSTKHILKFEEGKPMAFWYNEGLDYEGNQKDSFARTLTKQETSIMEPIVKQYQAFLLEENSPPTTNGTSDVPVLD